MTVTLSLEGLRQLAAELSNPGPALARVAERAVDAILDEARADTGGDLILSRFARGRITLAVDTTVKGATVVLKATPPGPWTLLEEGSSVDGWWIPRRGRVRLPDGGIRRYVRHGAVRAKRTFTRGREQVNAHAAQWMDEEVAAMIGRAA